MAIAAPKEENWRNVIAVAVAGFQLLWFVVWWALTGQLTQLQREIDTQADRMTKQFTRIEETRRIDDKIVLDNKRIDDRSAVETRRIDEKLAFIDASLTRIGEQIRGIAKENRDTFLAKDQYIARHEALSAEVTRTGDRLNELRGDFAKIYTPSDTIKEVQKRLEVLEARTFTSQK